MGGSREVEHHRLGLTPGQLTSQPAQPQQDVPSRSLLARIGAPSLDDRMVTGALIGGIADGAEGAVIGGLIGSLLDD